MALITTPQLRRALLKPARAFETERRVAMLLPSLPVGGRLTRFLEAWKELRCSSFVREAIEHGHCIPFNHGHPSFLGIRRTPLPGNKAKRQALLSEVESLLTKRAIEQVPANQARSGQYSIYFLVPKKTGDLRPILNLKPLNRTMNVQSFKM